MKKSTEFFLLISARLCKLPNKYLILLIIAITILLVGIDK